jgi:23S rRNA pseudouridine1911/1915/1917 synthase
MSNLTEIKNHFSDTVEQTGTLYIYESDQKTPDRIDKFLAGLIEGFSRTRIQDLIDQGCITLNDVELDSPSKTVQVGHYEIFVPDAAPAEPQGQDIPLVIVYEDDDLIVIDKPAGLVMHPAAGNPDQTLVNALIHHCGDSLSGIGGVARPGIVHRLDKDTSGLIVVAKNDITHRDLSTQFSNRTVERAYKALAWGRFDKPSGEIESEIGRHPIHRQKMASVKKNGRYALTHYKVERFIAPLASMVECRLKTGRTHQIRVHLSEMGHPLVGDPVYGGLKIPEKYSKKIDSDVKNQIIHVNRQCLHAYMIGFIHPITKKRHFFESKIPDDFNKILLLVEKAGHDIMNDIR